MTCSLAAPEESAPHLFDLEVPPIGVLTGEELRDFKALSDATAASAVASKSSNLTIRYESGFDLVCLKTEKRVAPGRVGHGGPRPGCVRRAIVNTDSAAS